MKLAVCYHSHHHGNTRKVLDAMALECDLELLDVAACQSAQLKDYDCIGFASGIYGFEIHKSVVDFAREFLPARKPVFFVCTYGLARGTGFKALTDLAKLRHCPILGEFGCKGYDTFGPFKLMGGLAKGHPDEQDFQQARKFLRNILNQL